MIWDTFSMNDELDMLELRLTELEDIPNLRHVIVEADVTHQDRPKPSHLRDNWARFERWHSRIEHVWATDLPTLADNPDAWAREHAQRERTRDGMAGASSADVVLHGDLDEIPRAVVARNVRPRDRYIALEMRGHFWAVDWLYPEPWCGTVAALAGNVGSFSAMRDQRNTAMRLHNAGWHLSWLGGKDRALQKVGSFCHPEVADRIHDGLDEDAFLRAGVHVDGKQMIPVDVNSTWPKWIVNGNASESWYRPR